MNKEMLEEYVLEARALREQVEVMARIARLLFEGTEDGAAFESFDFEQLQDTQALSVKVEDGRVYLG